MLFLLSIAIRLVSAEKVRFDNHRLYGVYIDTLEQIKLLRNLEDNLDGFLLWNNPAIGETVDVMVAPHKFAEFRNLTEQFDLQVTLKLKNVQRSAIHLKTN